MNFAIRRVSEDEWELIRAVRLAALKDSPDAFWAIYDEEAAFDEARWRDFMGSAWFVAEADGTPIGIAAGIDRFVADPNDRMLISMWVAPDARGAGVGRALVDAVLKWARADGAAGLRLWVLSGNSSAEKLYLSCGFVPTGLTEPLPRDPSLIEAEMTFRFDEQGRG